MSQVEVVRFDGDHIDAICRLQRLLWSEDVELNRRYLRWKYESNPDRNDCRLYLAFDGGKLVGVRGYYACRWLLRDGAAPTTVLTAADLCVEPEYRLAGVSRILVDRSAEDLVASGAPFALNASANKTNRLELMAAGWTSLGRFDLLDRRPSLSGAIRRLGFEVAPGWNRLDEGPHKPGVRVESSPRIREMAALSSRAPAAPVRLYRDEAFFDWRFANPLSEYRFLYFGDPDIAAYLVVQRWRTHDREWINLVDYAFENPPELAALVQTVVELCGRHDLRVWAPTNEAAGRIFAEAELRLSKHVAGIRDPRPALMIRPYGEESSAKEDPPRDFALWERAMAVSDYY